MRPNLWWNARPSFWGFRRKLKAQSSVRKARSRVCVNMRPMVSQSATVEDPSESLGYISQFNSDGKIIVLKFFSQQYYYKLLLFLQCVIPTALKFELWQRRVIEYKKHVFEILNWRKKLPMLWIRVYGLLQNEVISSLLDHLYSVSHFQKLI